MKEMLNKNIVYEGEFELKKSKFYSYVYYVKTQEECENIISNMKKEHSSARHVVFAYRLNNMFKYSDDKEPTNTAGKPIYSLIEKMDIVNVLVIVVRYFGGILLGTGPLTRSYASACMEALKKCELKEYVEYVEKVYVVDYSEEKNVLKQIENMGGSIVNIEHLDKVTIIANLPK